MDEIINTISGILSKSYGIDISMYNTTFLNKAIQKRIAEAQCESAEGYCNFLLQNSAEKDLFLTSLQISYSTFFRNSLTFSVIEQIVLPSVIGKKSISGRNEIRIWSAACAAGQEAYSLAMVMEGINDSRSIKTNYRIFATDQAKSQIDEAKEGKFSYASLSNVPLFRLNQWFIKHGETYTVKPELKKNIDFAEFDLFSGQYSSPPASIFGDFDLVMCANLLFYYKPEYQKKIFEKAVRSLSGDGFMVVGETEIDILKPYNYKEVIPQSGIFQIK